MAGSDRWGEPAGRASAGAELHANVGDSERWVSVIAGGMLALAGIEGRSLRGAALAALGAGLIYRGVSGRCRVYEQLGIDGTDAGSSANDAPAAGRSGRATFGMTDIYDAADPYDVKVYESYLVDEASVESFPASDPPSWTAMAVGPPRHRSRA